MKYKRKFRQGDKIKDLNELICQDYVYLFDGSPKSIRHISIIESMTLRTVEGFLFRGIYKAVSTSEENENLSEDIQHVGYDDEQCGRTK